jgi:hypothetical protein
VLTSVLRLVSVKCTLMNSHTVLGSKSFPTNGTRYWLLMWVMKIIIVLLDISIVSATDLTEISH